MDVEPNVLKLAHAAQAHISRISCDDDFENEGFRLAAYLALSEMIALLESPKAGAFWSRPSLKIEPAETMDRWLDRFARALQKCPTADHLTRLMADNRAMIDAGQLLPRWHRDIEPLLRDARRELGVPEPAAPELSY